MKGKWKPLGISLIVAILIHIGIIPWAMIQGTWNWQAAPLYLLFTVPAAVVVLVIGLIVSLVRKPAVE